MSLRLAQANLYPQQQKTEMAFTCSSLLGVRLPISIRHSTNDMKTLEGPGLSWPIPHTTPFFLPPEDPYPVLLRPNSTAQWEHDPAPARLALRPKAGTGHGRPERAPDRRGRAATLPPQRDSVETDR